jgi:hypothetical protein
MVKKGEVPCLLGNGFCHPDCVNWETAKNAYKASVGTDMTSEERRLAVVFGDVEHHVDVVDVTTLMAGCANEALPVQEDIV